MEYYAHTNGSDDKTHWQPLKEHLLSRITKDGKEQGLNEHLVGVADKTAIFTSKIGLEQIGEVIGLLHDLGKASKEFQRYLRSAAGLIDPDADDYVNATEKKGKVDHSSAGAQFIYNVLSSNSPEGVLTAQVLSLCLASHHSGLIDCFSASGLDNFSTRIEKSEKLTHTNEALSHVGSAERKRLDDLLLKGPIAKHLSQKLKELKEDNDSKETLSFKIGLFVRFLFSCLIDADRIDAADVEFPDNVQLRNYSKSFSWETLIERLNNKLNAFQNKNDVDELRKQVSQQCFQFSSKSKGIYQLTVPTGGGKTLASLRFALNHAAKNNMDRIFYIIPYTSIIDQNAEEVRKILEEKDSEGKYLDKIVLEHHSNLTPEKETRRQNLLSENWDAPIIFTTSVQFLETLFGSGTRGARRIHQLANSVIIFDEVQTIPVRCVHMFNVALRFLVNNCGSTIVLCTATQPLLDKVKPPQRALTISPDQRIMPDEAELFKKLKRVEVYDRRKIGGWSEKEIVELAEQELQNTGNVLIIVNTKSAARSLYQQLKEVKQADVYHLSTNMCPAHRIKVLNHIKDRLLLKRLVICVSTQLIEAGVDIDFGSVIRYLAGLDSIAQAAGRCNRNGKPRLGNVWIVNPAKENLDKLPDIRISIEKAQRVLDEYKDNPEAFDNDILGPKAMKRYYKYYFYDRKDEMNYPVTSNSVVGREDNLFNLLSTNTLSVQEYQRINNNYLPRIPLRQSFQTASKAFHAIDSPAQGVIVPYEDGNTIIKGLCSTGDVKEQHKLVRAAQRYCVNLFPHEWKKLENVIYEVEGAGIYFLDEGYYGPDFGLSMHRVSEMPFLSDC
jgi:CRISPR-associated endonuclease/helicase Cas3